MLMFLFSTTTMTGMEQGGSRFDAKHYEFMKQDYRVDVPNFCTNSFIPLEAIQIFLSCYVYIILYALYHNCIMQEPR